MARSKKESSHLNDGEKSEQTTVRIFSQRIGDIILPNGKLLKYGDVALVPEDIAEWAEASFKGFVKRIE